MSNSSTFFETLLWHAPDAIFWTRPDGSFAYVNEAACTLLRYSRAELIALTLFQVDADLEPQSWSELWSQLEANKVTTLVRRHVDKLGRAFPVEVRVLCVEWHGDLIHASFVRDLSESRRLAQLETSHETFFQALFRDSPTPQLIINPQTARILDANKAAISFYGYDAQALINKPLSDINELGPEHLSHEIERATQAERAYFELRHRLATGDVRDVQVFSKPIESDGATLLHSTIRDVTSSLQYQHQLENYRHHLEQLPVGVFRNTSGPEGTFVWVNQRLAEMLDAVSTDEIVGEPVAKFYLDPEHRAAFSERLLKAGDIYRDRLQLKTLRNRPIWVAVSARTTRDTDGQILFEGAVEDITHTKEQHEQLRLVDAAFENAHEGITLTDCDGTIIRVNKAFTRITGYRPDEVIGKTPRVLSSGFHSEAFYRQMWQAIELHGHWQGEIWNRRKDGTLLPEYLSISAVQDAEGQVGHYLGQFTDLSDLREAQTSLRELADFDPLTGLPNRRNLLDTISRLLSGCAAEGKTTVIMVLGADHFRHINDALAPAQGNLILQELAKRLKTELPETMQAFRASGDIFALVSTGHRAAPILEQMDQVVNRVVQNEFAPDDYNTIKLQFSCGSTSSTDPEQSAEKLFAEAEAAMFHAKQHNRRGHIVYSQGLTEDARQNMTLETELRRAIANRELTVHFQPIISVADNTLCAVEALARWFHPEKGMIPPDRFIPVAESTGLIRDLTLLIVSLACKQTVLIQNETGTAPRVAVNVSSPLIADPDFIETILQNARECGLPLNRLELEITESLLMQQYDQLTDILGRLASERVRISIDDFGTGYSSLAYLQDLNAGTLKIDRRFVNRATTSPKGGQLAASIIAMARELGMEVIGEGVETAEELAFLQRHHCDLYQGYFFSRPQPASNLLEMLR